MLLDCCSDAVCGSLPWDLVGTFGHCRQRICFSQHWQLYTYLYLLLFLVCQSKLLKFGIGFNVRQGLTPALRITGLCCLFAYKNLALSVLSLCWLLCFSGWILSLGCWLVWWSWGEAWSMDSLGLFWQRNRVCQRGVSHLVLCHPSILVVYSKLC